MNTRLAFPAVGRGAAALDELDRFARDDADWRHGRTWSLVYHASEAHADLLAAAAQRFAAENPLSPSAFPSLRRMEAESVSMILDLLDGPPNAAGTMASGGTESIMLALLSYRDRELAQGGSRREVIVPRTAHPAVRRACHYFGLTERRIPTATSGRVEVEAIAEALGPATLAIVASAPCFPYGVVDPIAGPAGIAALAANHGVALHVDACLGGMFMSVMRRLGESMPEFGLSVPGVTSVSVDLHKYGYGPKGTSFVLYSDAEQRRHQFFVDASWPGGALASPTMLGTRSGGAIAGAWVALVSMGLDGYGELYRGILATTRRLVAGIRAIEGLELVAEPDMSIVAFRSTTKDVFDLADRMGERGWRLDRQQNPDCLHVIVNPVHADVIDTFVSDLADDHAAATPVGASAKRLVLYGVTADVPAGAAGEFDADAADSSLRDAIEKGYS